MSKAQYAVTDKHTVKLQYDLIISLTFYIYLCFCLFSDPSTFPKKYRTFCRTSEKKIQDILQDFRSQFRYIC